MTDRDVVQRIALLLGRAIVPLRARATHHKRPFAVSVKGTAAVRLMASITNDLGERRQRQIAAALESWGDTRQRWSYALLSCAVTGCFTRASTHGLCDRHYNAWYKAMVRGAPTTIVARPLSAPDITRVDPPWQCRQACAVPWLAGLLEGEGWFGTSRTKGHAYPSISVAMRDQDVVGRVAQILGGRSISRRTPRDPNWSEIFTARVTGDLAATWMRRLLPLMGERRSAAIDSALTAYEPVRLTAPPPLCTVPGCRAPHRSRGLCHKHYMSWLRDVTSGRKPRITPLR